jgi:hypothetical protein
VKTQDSSITNQRRQQTSTVEIAQYRQQARHNNTEGNSVKLSKEAAMKLQTTWMIKVEGLEVGHQRGKRPVQLKDEE